MDLVQSGLRYDKIVYRLQLLGFIARLLYFYSQIRDKYILYLDKLCYSNDLAAGINQLLNFHSRVN